MFLKLKNILDKWVDYRALSISRGHLSLNNAQKADIGRPLVFRKFEV